MWAKGAKIKQGECFPVYGRFSVLVYFIHRFAIYIPLFLPIGLPVLGSLFKAFKWIKTKRKQKPKME